MYVHVAVTVSNARNHDRTFVLSNSCIGSNSYIGAIFSEGKLIKEGRKLHTPTNHACSQDVYRSCHTGVIALMHALLRYIDGLSVLV